MFFVRRGQKSVLLLLLLVIFIFTFVLSLLFRFPFLFRVHNKSEKCLVYSPAFPSLGRSGCKMRCVENEGKSTKAYVAAFYKENHGWPKELIENMEISASILKRYGHPQTLNTEGGRQLHLSFDYYCCYTEDEAWRIGKFLNNYSWISHSVRFDKIECAIHGYGDAVSLVLMADQKSQRELTRWALENERDLEVATGVQKHIPHTRLQDFHITLGTVNQSSFPVQSAVQEINRIIPPGKWHMSPVILHRSVCKGCERVIRAKLYR